MRDRGCCRVKQANPKPILPGPAQVYFSKAPSDDVKSYDGSGDWFKIRQALFCSNPGNDGALTDAWCTWGQPGIAFEIPDRLPDGLVLPMIPRRTLDSKSSPFHTDSHSEYLVRVEHIPLHGAQGKPGGAEFYYSCAQLKIEGNNGNTWLPTRTAKIPGMIQPDDEAVLFNIWTQVTDYPTAPGSELIIGGTTWGTSDGSGDGIARQMAKRAVGMGGSSAAVARAMVAN